MTEKDDEPRAAKDVVNLKVRFREETRKRLERAAKANRNSLNTELVERLEQSLAIGDRLGGASSMSLWQDLQRDIDRVENITGTPWATDRKTYFAVREILVARLSDRRLPYINEHRVLELKEQMQNQRHKIDGLIDVLINYGAIRKRSQGIGSGYYQQHFDNLTFADGKALEHLKIERTLLFYGHTPNIDLQQSPANWDLVSANGNEVDRDFATGVRAILLTLVSFHEKYAEMSLDWTDAYQPNKDAEEAGKLLATQILGDLHNSKPLLDGAF